MGRSNGEHPHGELHDFRIFCKAACRLCVSCFGTRKDGWAPGRAGGAKNAWTKRPRRKSWSMRYEVGTSVTADDQPGEARYFCSHDRRNRGGTSPGLKGRSPDPGFSHWVTACAGDGSVRARMERDQSKTRKQCRGWIARLRKGASLRAVARKPAPCQNIWRPERRAKKQDHDGWATTTATKC